MTALGVGAGPEVHVRDGSSLIQADPSRPLKVGQGVISRWGPGVMPAARRDLLRTLASEEACLRGAGAKACITNAL